MKVSRRKINQIGGAVATTSVMGSALSRPVFAEDTKKGGGALYMQTNELENAVIRFSRAKNGILKQEQRIATGGRGSGVFKPVSGQASAPNAFEGAGSVITTDDKRYLFTTNGGDNTVSTFSIDDDGILALIDCKPTGNAVEGKSGTAKSLAYASKTKTLYVLHAFGPNHIRSFSVDKGKLALRPESHTVNVGKKTDRVSTQAVLSPDQRFLLVDVLFDARPAENPDGTPNLVVTNAPDPDGLVIFPIDDRGALGKPTFNDAGGAGPFYIAFLHGSSDVFLNGVAVGDGVVVSTLTKDGRVRNDPLVAINTSEGKPSELCWLAISPDNKLVYATNFGYSNISSYRIIDKKVKIAKDPASAKVPGDGTFKAVNGVVSSGPSDSWLSPDGAFLYQIYGNASTLVGYATEPNGALTEVTRIGIPYNSPQGLVGA